MQRTLSCLSLAAALAGTLAGCGARPEAPAAEKPDLAAIQRAIDKVSPAPVKKPIPSTAKLATANLRITGMHCEGCAGGLVSQLNRLDGVQTARVSAEEKRGTVVYAPSICSPDDLVAQVRKGGFQASVVR
jgi:copper chaperone CopZ